MNGGLFAGSIDGPSKAAEPFDLVRQIDQVLPMEVQEQRVSNLLQSLMVALCLRESLHINPSFALFPAEGLV